MDWRNEIKIKRCGILEIWRDYYSEKFEQDQNTKSDTEEIKKYQKTRTEMSNSENNYGINEEPNSIEVREGSWEDNI